MMLAIVTFIISVPILYFLFNRSLDATINNFHESKSNFERLYKDSGKIKLKNY